MDMNELNLEINISTIYNLVLTPQKTVPLFHQENQTVFFLEIILLCETDKKTLLGTRRR